MRVRQRLKYLWRTGQVSVRPFLMGRPSILQFMTKYCPFEFSRIIHHNRIIYYHEKFRFLDKIIFLVVKKWSRVFCTGHHILFIVQQEFVLECIYIKLKIDLFLSINPEKVHIYIRLKMVTLSDQKLSWGETPVWF